MDQFKQISAFVGVASRGSMSATACAEGVTPAIIDRCHVAPLPLRVGLFIDLLKATWRDPAYWAVSAGV